MEKFRFVVGLCLLFRCVLCAQSCGCLLNMRNNLDDRQPLLLRKYSNKFLYPKKCTGQLYLKELQEIRVVCPHDNIFVSRKKLAVSDASAECRGNNIFELLETGSTAKFKKINCARTPKAEAIRTDATCPNGTIAQIGFRVKSSSFVPSIEQICHNETLGQTHWVHSRVVLAPFKSQVRHFYEIGPFYRNMIINQTIFTKISQRARLQTLLNDLALVDKIIAPNGTDYLVEGMLVPKSDMYYRAQQYSTFFYINTVPMWKSVRDGNWKIVERFVRVRDCWNMANLDVWTGGIDVMTISGTGANATLFTLTTDWDGNGAIPVPRFLFKYVVDTANNQGLVFITLNDPFPKHFNDDVRLCKPREVCMLLFPNFERVELGYTYCCTVDQNSKFASIAMKLGLPIFDKILPLF